MAFLALCPNCDHAQVCVLDWRAEPRLRCPICRCHFTAAQPAFTPVSVPTIQAADSEATADAPPPMVAVAIDPPTVVTMATPTDSERPARSSTSSTEAGDSSHWRFTAATLALIAITLLVAAIDSLGFLVLPLAGLSLVAGLFAVRRAILTDLEVRWPAAATGVAAIVFFLSLTVPGFLRPGYPESDGPETSATEIRVVPFPQFASAADQLNPQWVDASQASLQQGRVRVEIAEAWISPVQIKKGPPPGARMLAFRVRLYRSKTGQEISSGAFSPSLSWDRGHLARLGNGSGAMAEQREPGALRGRASGPSSSSSPTIDLTDEILAFDLPPTLEDLRLELPAAAWGGSGQFRFGIPASMVRTSPGNPGP